MKNKKLFIIFLVILFLFVFNIKINAFSYEYEDVTYNCADFPFDVNDYDFFIRSGVEGDSWYRGFAVPKGSCTFIYYRNNKNLKLTNISGETIKYYDFSTSSGNIEKEWTYINEKSLSDNSSITMSSSDYLRYSTIDVYDDNGEIFFIPAPLSTLEEIVETAQLQVVMIQIVKVVGLTLVVVVSYLGLRKALKLLSTLFYQS